MGIVVDLIVVGVIALFTFLGYKKGLVDVAYKLIALLAALILTFILFKPVSNYIVNNTEFDEKVEQIILENTLSESDDKSSEEEKNENSLTKYVQKYVTDKAKDTKNTTIQAVSKDLSISIVNGLVFITLFIVLRICLIVLKLVSEAIASLPIIKQFNELGGAIYGLVKGLLLVYIVFAVIFIVAPMVGGMSIVTYIDASFISKMIYGNNIILNLIF